MMDIYAMRGNRSLTAWFGLGLVAVVGATVALVIASFNGAFSSAVDMTAQLPPSSHVVAINSPVHYRDVNVGKVVSGPHTDSHGNVVVDIQIDPSRVKQIPGSVATVVAPVSIFGNEFINLIPDAAPGGRPLHSGSVIPPVQPATAPSLQSTFVSLDDVLNSVHLGDLNAGLSGLSQALAGRGTSLGQTLVSANTYLDSMLKQWPQLVEDLKQFAPFATTLAASTPAFLDLARNATVTSQTLAKHAADFSALIANGAAAAAQGAALIGQTQQLYANTLAGADALLKALSQSPTVISHLLSDFSALGSSWTKALSGSTIHVQGQTLQVTNPADLALAMVSGKNTAALLARAVSGPFVNPPTYTGADCPSYGTETGNCGGGR